LNFQLSASKMVKPLLLVVCPLLSPSSPHSQKKMKNASSFFAACPSPRSTPVWIKTENTLWDLSVFVVRLTIDVIGPKGDAPVLPSDGGSEMLWRQCFAKMDS
jgi:hypothetical protein